MASRRRRKLRFSRAQPEVEPLRATGFPAHLGAGDLLREARELRREELQTVANNLRIRLAYLQAIEEGRFKELPGSTYAVGFVRSYADYLGLDSADVVRRFREEVAKAHGKIKLVVPTVDSRGKVPPAAVLLLSILGIAVIYGVWYYRSSQDQVSIQPVTEVPDRLIALSPDQATPAQATATQATANQTAASGAASDGTPATGAATADAAASEPAGAATTASSAAEPAVAADSADDIAASAGTAAASTDSAASAVPTVEPSIVVEEIAAVAETQGSSSPAVDAVAPAIEAAAGQAAAAPATGSAGATSAAESGGAGSFAGSATEPAAVAEAESDVDNVPPAPELVEVTQELPEPSLAELPDGAIPGVVLEARMDSWVSVVGRDGKRIFGEIMQAGDRYIVPANQILYMATGNAGGIDIIVDGVKLPPLGEVGAVRKRIPLDPEKLKAFVINN